MPNRFLCPKCRGQRTTCCSFCRGSGKRSIAGIAIGKCKECNGNGQRRCDVCGGTGEIEAVPRDLKGNLVLDGLALGAARTNVSRDAKRNRHLVVDYRGGRRQTLGEGLSVLFLRG